MTAFTLVALPWFVYLLLGLTIYVAVRLAVAHALKAHDKALVKAQAPVEYSRYRKEATE